MAEQPNPENVGDFLKERGVDPGAPVEKPLPWSGAVPKQDTRYPAERLVEERAAQKEAVASALDEAHAAYLKSITVQSATPHEGPAELPHTTKTNEQPAQPPKTRPNPVQNAIRNILRFFGAKNV
ncbi:MAG: hypothetical protein AAB855_05305, partial [Patescibacteria group bacterium]